MILSNATQTSMRRFVMGDRFTEFQELSDALSELTPNTGRAFDRAAAETYIAGSIWTHTDRRPALDESAWIPPAASPAD